MSAPEPHEAVVGRRGWWEQGRWIFRNIPQEAFGPRAHPERCGEEFHDPNVSRYERAILLRLTMIGVWGLWAVVGGSAFLLFRWLRLACWLTGCHLEAYSDEGNRAICRRGAIYDWAGTAGD